METNKNIFEKSISFLKGRYLAIIFILLAPTVVGILFDYIKKGTDKTLEGSPMIIVWAIISGLITLALAFLGISFKIGLYRYLDSENNQKGIAIKELVKNNWKKIGLFAVFGITASLVTIVPFLLFIIPGLIVGLIIQMAYFFFVIREKGIFDSISLSFHIVKGRVWEFLKKVLYPFVVKILPHFLVILIVGGVSATLILGSEGRVSIMVVAPIALILSAYSIYKLVINTIASIVYNYYLFLELEKTAPAITEEQLKKSKTKLIVLTVLGVLALIIILVAVSIFLIALSYRAQV